MFASLGSTKPGLLIPSNVPRGGAVSSVPSKIERISKVFSVLNAVKLMLIASPGISGHMVIVKFSLLEYPAEPPPESKNVPIH